MANALFSKGKQALLGASAALDADTIKAVLVDHGVDTPVPGTDQYLSDIAAGARIAAGTLASKTITNGTFDAADITFSGVSGASAESIVIYKDTGNAATSPLIAFIDTATGLPVTPNAGDITIVWDAAGIFSI